MRTTRNIIVVTLLYFITVVGIIYSYASLYHEAGILVHQPDVDEIHEKQTIKDVGDNPDFEEYLYFSGITYLTIGYGDYSPNPEGYALCISQGIIGLVFNGIYIGLIFYVAMRTFKTIYVPKYIFVKGNEIITFFGIRKGQLIDCKVRIVLSEKDNESEYMSETILDTFQYETNDIDQFSYFTFNVNKWIEKLKKEPTLQVQYFVKGYNLVNKETVYSVKRFSKSKIRFISNHTNIIKYKKNGKKKIQWLKRNRYKA